MTTPAADVLSTPRAGEPTWNIAHLFPLQGSWSEAEYLALDSNRLLEFSNGHLEVLPAPTDLHQAILAFLYETFSAFVGPGKLGKVRFAALPMRLWEGKYREPDLLFLLTEHAARRHAQYWDGADLVLEVVSNSERRRDLEIKRNEYEKAGISEYWIVDPRNSQITVLHLDNGQYAEHGIFPKGSHAMSGLLPDFKVDVSAVFAVE